MNHAPHLKIGALIAACEAGFQAQLNGRPAVLPKRFWNSARLERAYWTGFDLARRYEGATDGPAR
jgi:hypothetical protein